MAKQIKKFNLLVCKWCGKKGFKKIKEIKLSGNRTHDFMNKECDYCNGQYISKDAWDVWEKKEWTTKQLIKKKVQKILKQVNLDGGFLSLDEIDALYKSKKINLKKEYKEIINLRKTKGGKKKIKNEKNKKIISELSKVFLFILIAFPFFVISPLMGVSFVFIAAVWYSLLQGDFWR